MSRVEVFGGGRAEVELSVVGRAEVVMHCSTSWRMRWRRGGEEKMW